MKRSEYQAVRKSYWSSPFTGEDGFGVYQRIDQDVAAAEAAGVIWDPEEEPPMAERLVVWLPRKDSGNPAMLRREGTAEPATERELAIAADLYNRREVIDLMPNCLRAVGRSVETLLMLMPPQKSAQGGAAVRHAEGLGRELAVLADRLEGKE